MFVANLDSNKSRVEAASAIRKFRHICPHCSELVILHRGKVKRPHFSHAKNSLCPYRQGETWQHEQAKAAILAGARVRGLVAKPELEVLSIDGDRRADVIIFPPPINPLELELGQMRAFEVQYSAISSENLIERTRSYMNAGVPVLWIAVIDDNKFKTMYRVEGTNLICVSGYSVPSWVEDFANLHRRLWIYVPQSNGFWRAWLLPNWRYKNPTDSYYDNYGEHHSGRSGYWEQAAKKQDLYLDGPYAFKDFRIATENHSDNPIISPKGEKCWLIDLWPQGLKSELTPPIEQKRCPHIDNGRDTGFYVYKEWLKLDGNEAIAKFIHLDTFPKIADVV